MKLTKAVLIGASAKSDTEAGVEMAATMLKGEPDERREVVGIFKSGVILDAKRITIDYGKWPDVKDEEGIISYSWIGRVHSYECFVENDKGARGWVAAGALNITPTI